MPTLKDQQRLAEYGLLKSDQTLGIFSMLKRMEEELRKEIIGKIEKEFSANAINERMVKNILKDIKGEKGDNPTKEELLDLIKDVFESIRPSLKGERGETPTERELRLLVEKSIDKIKHQLKGEKGNPPDKREIEQIVRSVFEDLSPSLKGEKGDFFKITYWQSVCNLLRRNTSLFFKHGVDYLAPRGDQADGLRARVAATAADRKEEDEHLDDLGE